MTATRALAVVPPRRLDVRPMLGWLALVLSIILLWALVVRVLSVPAIIAPDPFVVLGDLWVSRDRYTLALGQTILTAAGGLLLGTVIALVLAVAAWWSASADAASRPLVYFLQAIPMTALIPVVSGLVGYGYGAVITLTTLSTLFPTYVIVGTALASPPGSSVQVMAALGATRGQLLRHVALPAALPSLFVALQLGATLAILGSFATEYLQGGWGLGGLFALARREFSNPAMPWGIAILATLLSALSYALFHALAQRVASRFA
ncbi:MULTISPECIES: ABC transporter permease [unclassified Rathayibacter]|uniref:ABC transporter permease n=1 Tax=unclassified Rathayibacter TaxID=2609250 RepID=UPI00160DA811|nr:MULTISPECIES: ABC transporter permease subunit [unclassified Rathayibacter]